MTLSHFHATSFAKVASARFLSIRNYPQLFQASISKIDGLFHTARALVSELEFASGTTKEIPHVERPTSIFHRFTPTIAF